MKKFTITLALIGSLITAAACSSGGGSGDDIFSISKVNAGKVVVTVNGQDIHEGLLNVLGDLSPRLKSQIDNPLTRKKILTSLVEQQLLYQEAIKRGLGKTDDVKLKTLLNEHTIVSNSLLEKQLDDAMKKAFDERKDSEFTKLGISQIVVNAISEEEAHKGTKPTDEQKKQAEQKAKALKARLDKGEDFAAVAKEASDDKRTASKGGDAGQVSKNDKRLERLGLKDVTAKAFTLKKGQVSDLIATPTAYYIVKVTSDPEVSSFEDAKRVLGFELQTTVKDKLLEDLKKGAKITYADDNQPKTEAPKLDAKPSTTGGVKTPAMPNAPVQNGNTTPAPTTTAQPIVTAPVTPAPTAPAPQKTN